MSRDPLSELPPVRGMSIDRRCAAYEHSWGEGRRPRLEEFLDGAGVDRPALLFHLLRMELELRRGRGEAPAAAEYQERFPGDGELIARAYAEAPTEPGAPEPSAGMLPKIPGFEVMRRLGGGGMGDVYLVRNLRLNREAALKTVRAGWSDPGALGRARDEAKALALLNDPHVVQVYGVDDHDGRPYLEMEYVRGESLDRRLRRSPQAPAQAARLVETLACTLHTIHGRNLVHRDLKPANILLFGEPGAPLDLLVPKVADFGLVKHLDAGQGRTVSGEVLGTPSYMAPEQARGRSHEADRRTDVWALGAILYECLTGRPPFLGETVIDTLMQVCELDPVRPRLLNEKVDASLEFICLKCLEKKPEHRYGSAAELAADLRRWIDHKPVVPTSWPVWLWRQVNQRCRIENPDLWAGIAAFSAAWSLAGHSTLALLLHSNGGAAAFWFWIVALHAGEWAVVVPLLLGRQRLDPAERGILINWAAAMSSDVLLFALFCPPWGRASPEEVVRVYPVWLTIHGLMWIMEARLYWGRFYVLGLAFLCIAPLLTLCGLLAPAAFGLVNAAGLLWLAAGLRRIAAERARAAPAG